MTRWIMLWALGGLAAAALAHIILTLMIPGLAMERTYRSLATQAGGVNVMLSTPPVNHTSQTVVRPAPDLLYSVCAYDLSSGPVEIAFDPPQDSYWSLSFFQMNTDVFELLSNRSHGRSPIRVRLMDQPKKGEGLIYAPSTRGIALIRLYLRDRGDYLAELQQVQQSATCRAAGST